MLLTDSHSWHPSRALPSESNQGTTLLLAPLNSRCYGPIPLTPNCSLGFMADRAKGKIYSGKNSPWPSDSVYVTSGRAGEQLWGWAGGVENVSYVIAEPNDTRDPGTEYCQHTAWGCEGLSLIINPISLISHQIHSLFPAV